MRLLAFTTPELPRFSWTGSIEIVGLGAAWGLITAPGLLVLRRGARQRTAEGPIFGLLALGLAVPPFFVLSGFRGSLVAPASFLWLAALSFPALFALHGLLASSLSGRWRRPPRGRAHTPPTARPSAP